MKIIRVIRDADLGLDTPGPQEYEERSVARAIVFDSEKKVAPLNATKKSY